MNNNKTWKSRWLTPKARAINSEVHEIGISSVAPIAKGEIISVLGGVIVPLKDVGEYRRTMCHIGIQVNDEFFICPRTREELSEVGAFNHSCRPNVGYSDSITLVAIDNISTNTELAFDYAFSETLFEAFSCKCGFDNCRRVIKPSDWELTEVQDNYLDYYSPYLKAKVTSHTKTENPDVKW